MLDSAASPVRASIGFSHNVDIFVPHSKAITSMVWDDTSQVLITAAKDRLWRMWQFPALWHTFHYQDHLTPHPSSPRADLQQQQQFEPEPQMKSASSEAVADRASDPDSNRESSHDHDPDNDRDKNSESSDSELSESDGPDAPYKDDLNGWDN